MPESVNSLTILQVCENSEPRPHAEPTGVVGVTLLRVGPATALSHSAMAEVLESADAPWCLLLSEGESVRGEDLDLLSAKLSGMGGECQRAQWRLPVLPVSPERRISAVALIDPGCEIRLVPTADCTDLVLARLGEGTPAVPQPRRKNGVGVLWTPVLRPEAEVIGSDRAQGGWVSADFTGPFRPMPAFRKAWFETAWQCMPELLGRDFEPGAVLDLSGTMGLLSRKLRERWACRVVYCALSSIDAETAQGEADEVVSSVSGTSPLAGAREFDLVVTAPDSLESLDFMLDLAGAALTSHGRLIVTCPDLMNLDALARRLSEEEWLGDVEVDQSWAGLTLPVLRHELLRRGYEVAGTAFVADRGMSIKIAARVRAGQIELGRASAGQIREMAASHCVVYAVRRQPLMALPDAASSPSSPLLTVIVVGESDITREFVDRLFLNTSLPFEAIFVNSGVTGEMRRYLITHKSSRLVPADGEIWAVHVNAGLRLAVPCEYVVIVDSRCILPEAWFEGLLECSVREGAGLVGPMLNTASAYQRAPGVDGFLSSDADLEQRVQSYALRARSLHYQTSVRALTLSRQCVLIRADVLRTIGGFDEDYLQMDDVDFCLRAAVAGFNAAIARDVYVHCSPSLPRSTGNHLLMDDEDIFRTKWGLEGSDTISQGSLLRLSAQPFEPSRHVVPLE